MTRTAAQTITGSSGRRYFLLKLFVLCATVTLSFAPTQAADRKAVGSFEIEVDCSIGCQATAKGISDYAGDCAIISAHHRLPARAWFCSVVTWPKSYCRACQRRLSEFKNRCVGK